MVRLFARAEGFRSPAAPADQHCVRRRSWEQQAMSLGLHSRALFTLTCATLKRLSIRTEMFALRDSLDDPDALFGVLR